MHSDLDGPNASEEVRLIATGAHYIPCLDAGFDGFVVVASFSGRDAGERQRRREDGFDHVMLCLFSWSGGLVPRASQASLRRDRLAFPWIFQSG